MADATARLDPRYVNRQAQLPYGLTVRQIEEAVAETYRLVHGIDAFLLENGFRHLEELILANSFSGLISEFLVKNIAGASPTPVANTKVGGHPDLLPVGQYESESVLKGEEGIEVKASVHRGRWQGHNPEDSWVMVFVYSAGHRQDAEWVLLQFREILCARLAKADWSFSGRTGASRRTPTASIGASGVEKLRANFVYRIPGAGVGRHRLILAHSSDAPHVD